MLPSDVRKQLVEALRLDMVGPDPTRNLGRPDEVLPQAPSRWYLTGFLVPLDAGDEQRVEETSAEEMDEAGDARGGDDGTTPEPVAARLAYMPSSIGLSILVPASAQHLRIIVRWGDYHPVQEGDGQSGPILWQRTAREEAVAVDIPDKTAQPIESPVPNSMGLQVVLSVRPVPSDGLEGGLPAGIRYVSVFLVNRRTPAPDITRDVAYAFQTQLDVTCDAPLVPRPNLRSLESNDWDERVADLQYRDAFEFAVGHSVAAETIMPELGFCREVRTCWIPEAEVERVAPAPITSVELSMEALGLLADGADAKAKLGNFVVQYRAWINKQRAAAASLPTRRKDAAKELLDRADVAANRIEQGILLLNDPQCLDAFKIANRVMAMAGKRRGLIMDKKDPATVTPKWRPFQLAFLLMNLPGVADPTHADRRVVDLLFFPTGGGKTEAYLGLAAFTLVMRRKRNPGLNSAGLSVLMRYTLRLLTLDQLSRAATVICALELERQTDVEKLGTWPFEIGLWVGKAATPNVMGNLNDGNKESVRAKTIAFKNDDRKPSPIPLEECPWCGTKFKAASFQLLPNPTNPTDLRVACIDRRCEFSGNKRPLPIVAVDEPIYRRLPCFMIATVDKFAAMPWTGEVGAFFGRVQRYDKDGFYGPCNPTKGQPLGVPLLLPPDLVIQDELHLISGPLGTMCGLYETALDELSSRMIGDTKVGPKIVASTATVRRAENQIRALFNRGLVDIFPPPGPDRRDSFFAEVHSPQQSNARLYLGIAAQGRSPKVVMLRVYLTLLAAAQKAYLAGPKGSPSNPTDPYMTLLGYFNSLRELGGARRIIEDEVGSRLGGYGSRKRAGEATGLLGMKGSGRR